MPASALVRIAERRPDRFTSALVEELLVLSYRLIQRRGLAVAGGTLFTATGRIQPVVHVTIVSLAMEYLEGHSLERDVLLYFVKRAAWGEGLSHTAHARCRYGRSRKWLLDIRKRALRIVTDGLNRDGCDPYETILGRRNKAA